MRPENVYMATKYDVWKVYFFSKLNFRTRREKYYNDLDDVICLSLLMKV